MHPNACNLLINQVCSMLLRQQQENFLQVSLSVTQKWMRVVATLLAVLLAYSPGLSFAAKDWSGEVLYFVLLDRFADGDSSSNIGVQRNNPGGYHGGDLKGLTQQLGELSDLGVTALWINPVQKQMVKPMYAQAPAKLGIPEFQHFGFHGYWIDDFETMEPHFGSVADLKQLVDEAHKRGIKVLLDVVYNHSGYSSKYSDRKTSDGEPWMRSAEGNCEVDPVKCRVAGLPDFKTELPEVRNYLLQANINLAKQAGVDGFRLDTYKHVETDFWLAHRKLTRSEISPDFFLLAEYWGGNATSLDPFFARDEVDAGFDFSFKGSCESFANGRGRAIAFGSYLAKRHAIRKGYQVAHYMSTHDEPMALANLGGDKAKFRLCAAIQMTSIGIPVIYYGEEVGRGGSEWPTNRNDMPWGERNIDPGHGIARDESLRDFYKSLLHVRKEHPALTRGNYTLLSSPQEKSVAYLRTDVASNDQVLVLANREPDSALVDYSVPESWIGQQIVDALSGASVQMEAGRIKLTMAPVSVRILTAPLRKTVP
jgi:alpha-amylase